MRNFLQDPSRDAIEPFFTVFEVSFFIVCFLVCIDLLIDLELCLTVLTSDRKIQHKNEPTQ